jgi:glycosyltransferase involved in cell wall biosynthesis
MSRRRLGWLIPLSRKIGVLRGVAGFLIGRSYELIVIAHHERGGLSLLFLQAFFGSRPRRLMLVQFITQRGSGLKRLLYPIIFRLLFRPAVRRAMTLGLVLTPWEGEHYAAMFGVPAARFHFVPWPLNEGIARLPPAAVEAVGVVSSGRTACDWQTLFRAAEGRTWPLTVICGKRDLDLVQKLNRGGRGRVLCEISLEEHRKYVASAAVYVLSLTDKEISSGQIRMMHAISAGTPVVATKVRGLEGYCISGVTAAVVPPGDPIALRASIERLLDHPEEREQLRRAAFEHTRGETFDRYYQKVAAAAAALLDSSA